MNRTFYEEAGKEYELNKALYLNDEIHDLSTVELFQRLAPQALEQGHEDCASLIMKTLLKIDLRWKRLEI